jgi:hypothetical protein
MPLDDEQLLRDEYSSSRRRLRISSKAALEQRKDRAAILSCERSRRLPAGEACGPDRASSSDVTKPPS